MRDPKRGKLTEQLSFRIWRDTFEKLEAIQAQENRVQNDVARMLLERGIAAYERDGRLSEPPEKP